MQERIPTSVVPIDPMTGGRFELPRRLSWQDPDIGATLVLSQPTLDPDLWAEFSLGAERSYRKHGVECALDLDMLRSGADTVMFFAMIDEAGRMVGGLRAKGPLRSADDTQHSTLILLEQHPELLVPLQHQSPESQGDPKQYQE